MTLFMTKMFNSPPLVITGAGRRLGLALAQHLSAQGQPLIISYRHHYPAIDALREAGVLCIAADFSTEAGIMAFAGQLHQHTRHIRALIHNASHWQAERSGEPDGRLLTSHMQIHVHAPYLLNLTLEPLLRGQGLAGADIIHITDYVAQHGSTRHIAYAASKAALDNLTCSFASKLAPEVKVNTIAPSLLLFHSHDDTDYRQQALDKSLMKIEAGAQEFIALVDYLLASRYVTGHRFTLDGGRHLR